MFSACVCFLCVKAASVFVNSASVVFRLLSSGHGLHTHNTANNDRRQAKIAEETRRRGKEKTRRADEGAKMSGKKQ